MAGGPDVVIAPRYLARFRCIAEACEDTCCHGWKVAIDPTTVARWDAELGAARVTAVVDREHLRLRVIDAGEPPGAGQDCALLAPDRRCAIHRDLGEDALPDTCALFPRVLQRAGDRLEATATLACPELARLSLLAPDAHELVELPASPLLTLTPHTRVPPADAARPWIALAPALRDAIDRALADPTWPIATRLFAVARLGEATRPYFHARTSRREARRLADDVAAAFTPRAMQAADDELFGATPAAFAGPALVADLLAARLAAPTAPALHALLEAALAGVVSVRPERAVDGPAVTSATIAGAPQPSPERLWAAHDQRTAALPDDVAARLDVIDAAWARHVWRQRWHLFAPDLFAHGLLHLVGRAFARTLLAAHPLVVTDVDVAAVEVIRLYARHVEHAGLHDQLGPRLRAAGLETRAVARSLILF